MPRHRGGNSPAGPAAPERARDHLTGAEDGGRGEAATALWPPRTSPSFPARRRRVSNPRPQGGSRPLRSAPRRAALPAPPRPGAPGSGSAPPPAPAARPPAAPPAPRPWERRGGGGRAGGRVKLCPPPPRSPPPLPARRQRRKAERRRTRRDDVRAAATPTTSRAARARLNSPARAERPRMRSSRATPAAAVSAKRWQRQRPPGGSGCGSVALPADRGWHPAGRGRAPAPFSRHGVAAAASPVGGRHIPARPEVRERPDLYRLGRSSGFIA